MLTYVWIALAFAVIVPAGLFALAVTRAFRAWRTFRSLLRAVARKLSELERKAAATETKATAVSAKTADVAAAAERLQESLDKLATLRVAWGEAMSPIARVRGFAPRK
ncbi:MAG TPA: hypothetical protein VFW85_01595 [Gaiellaceae bacterium]|nr:hypothetical protein [Gaiellaceae bacterium]